jgi:hypothetical protein
MAETTMAIEYRLLFLAISKNSQKVKSEIKTKKTERPTKPKAL